MTPANVPTSVVNPYLAYNFPVKWDGNYMAPVTTVSGLSRKTAVVSPPGRPGAVSGQDPRPHGLRAGPA